jgi:two-component system NtrC family sensor kinase
MMPGISGKEALDRMRAITPDLKALFLSGYEADLLQKKYDMQENYELLNKPVFAVTLLDKVREILDR